MQIQRQVDILPGYRRHLFEQAHHATMVIDFHLLITGHAVELFFVIAFDALLADIMVRSIVFRLAVFVQALQVAVVDFRYIADHVRQLGAVGVVTLLVALHRDARKTELVDRKSRHFNIAQGRLQGHLLVATVVVHIVAETGDIIGAQIHDRCQCVQQCGHIGNFARDHLQAVEGDVLYQRDTVAIENKPTAWRDRQHFYVILIRSGLIEIVLLNL